MPFNQVEPHPDFAKKEEEILEFWRTQNIFSKTLDKNAKKDKFVFYEGPPTANGKPGIHHVLARAFKDLIPRYKTMQGFSVPRRAGWDTHGLPVEIEVEKKLNLKNKKEIEAYGIAKFNQECRQSVWQYKEEWERLTERMGFWLDMSDPYVTYKNSYIEKVWQIIKEIWDAGLIYQGFKVVPYCPRCGTTLSTHEVAQGYKNIQEDSVYLKFKICDQDKYLLVWTTTPWTLPSNIALAINQELDYVEVKFDDEIYIIAKAQAEKVLGPDFKILNQLKGKDLIGISYEPLYRVDEFINVQEKDYKVYPADFVSSKDGTGIVHIAPAFGEDDMNLQNKFQFSIPQTVSDEGLMLSEVGKGQFIKDADTEIIADLRGRNLFFKAEKIKHDYPFCWRCDGVLIYFAKSSWFIRMNEVKPKMIEVNEKINWYPGYIKNGRFGEWLREVKDWAISRERYWGTPLPIWRCQEQRREKREERRENYCDYNIAIGSIEELKKLSQTPIDEKNLDLHRPFVDEIILKCPKCAGQMKRVNEVLDVWFDSGSMPFASGEYPQNYPADFISEAIDQTRGWFYTMLAISSLLDKGASYKNVICLAHVLDEKGKKMSKSKGNVIDPWFIINKYGVDALRWYFYSVNGPGEAKRLGEKEVDQVLKKFILILWNVYSFFVTYANADKWTIEKNQSSDRVLDRWIKNRLNEIILSSEDLLEKYDILNFARQIQDFVTDLSTWYLRRSRTRRDDKFYATLYQVLMTLTKLIAPLTPFTAEMIYQNLRASHDPESVHLNSWPQISSTDLDEKIIEQVKKIRQTVEEVHRLRAEHKIRLRQPLAKLEIPYELEKDLQEVLRDEVNVFEIKIGKKLELDTNLTTELRDYGTMRDLIREIQNLRKIAGLVPGEDAILYYAGDKKLEDIINKFNGDILKTTKTNLKNEKTEDILSESSFIFQDGKIWLGISK